ncbi:MAG TPA: hypothetical protein DHM90_03910 [Clostridiaceae bacterium]|nr:hypothetical protein [Clostridiaceae bacterium]
MIVATWNDEVIARSDRTIVVENNHYFPTDDVNTDFLTETDHHTTCPWKGEASYFDIEVNGKKNANAAWTYKEPKTAAAEIKNHVAFWKGVSVREEK